MKQPGPWPGRAFPYVVGESQHMQDVYAVMALLVGSDTNVWLEGERGTGTELIAAALHAAGPRASRPYVTFDSTTADQRALDARLAARGRCAATLFLDDIGALAPSLQASLLQITTSRTDLRVIAASTRTARSLIDDGCVLDDLHRRLAPACVELPPLRQRTGDIRMLVAHFLPLACARHGKSVSGFTQGVIDRLTAHTWPGNLRELENVVERAVVMADVAVLDIDQLPSFADEPPPACPSVSQRLTLRQVERLYILDTLEQARWNRVKAARLLGISVRGLHYKLQRYLSDKTSGGVSTG